jgi:glutamate racemase
MIGIFDSGVGGMTVARAVEDALPGYPQIYFGDLARAPYGPKSPEKIIQYARQNSRFLVEQGARMIVIACNSAASVAAGLIRSEFDVPVFEVITPAVHQAVSATTKERVGVIGTRATIRSGVYERMIKAASPGVKVVSAPCPLLVPLVEEGWHNRRETKMIVRHYLHPLKVKQVDTLVLGCTHYPLLRDLIQPRIGKRVKVIDSSEAVASELGDFTKKDPVLAEKLAEGGESRYYVSDVTDAARRTAARIFGRKIDLEIANGNV